MLLISCWSFRISNEILTHNFGSIQKQTNNCNSLHNLTWNNLRQILIGRRNVVEAFCESNKNASLEQFVVIIYDLKQNYVKYVLINSDELEIFYYSIHSRKIYLPNPKIKRKKDEQISCCNHNKLRNQETLILCPSQNISSRHSNIKCDKFSGKISL